MVMLATMMIPFMVTIMPLFLIMAKMGLINNRAFWVIWGIPGLPFIIFLFKQYFSTIPASFEESARLDFLIIHLSSITVLLIVIHNRVTIPVLSLTNLHKSM